MRTFYSDFATCYGTIWIILIVISFLSSAHIDTGLFGLLGFPLIALVYAALRTPSREAARRHLEELEARARRLRGELRDAPTPEGDGA